MARFVSKYFKYLTQSLRFTVFETNVGVKYKHGRFDSKRFDLYKINILPFSESCDTFSSLILPPDLLKNKYTLCGVEIPESPHFRLIKDIETCQLTDKSEYLVRFRAGTLDARFPTSLNPNVLYEKYRLRMADVEQSGTLTIVCIKVQLNGEIKYVIADGKHRAALAAYLNKPDSLYIQQISNEFIQEPFFKKVYSYILKLDEYYYSINQNMIKALNYESKIT